MKPETVIIRESIRSALELGQFEVYYQPIVDIVANKIISGEALLRWNHPELGLLYPGSFIPSAEETGMISLLGEFVVRDVCRQVRKWMDGGWTSARVCINLSIAQLCDPFFAKKVQQILRDCDVPPESLEFEVTETMAMSDPKCTLALLRELKEMGATVSLDDFGTGYSSLSHLHQFPVDVLKLDGDFVQTSLMSEKGSKLMRAIMLMAHTLDLEVVVEGVETEEQLLLLKLLGGKLVQGYFFSKPVPAQDYLNWCASYATTHQPALDFRVEVQ
jgi:EAL domain-containing protein (putative c-di-GMP-specific phosphodiesterase class I)